MFGVCQIDQNLNRYGSEQKSPRDQTDDRLVRLTFIKKDSCQYYIQLTSILLLLLVSKNHYYNT